MKQILNADEVRKIAAKIAEQTQINEGDERAAFDIMAAVGAFISETDLSSEIKARAMTLMVLANLVEHPDCRLLVSPCEQGHIHAHAIFDIELDFEKAEIIFGQEYIAALAEDALNDKASHEPTH